MGSIVDHCSTFSSSWCLGLMVIFTCFLAQIKKENYSNSVLYHLHLINVGTNVVHVCIDKI